ncbi:MAG: hypothetical protein AAGD32_05215 [Planctomycetota bacterium]
MITITIASTKRVARGKTRLIEVPVAKRETAEECADFLGFGKWRGDPQLIREAVRTGAEYRGCRFHNGDPKRRAARNVPPRASHCRPVTVVGIGDFPSQAEAARRLKRTPAAIRQALVWGNRVAGYEVRYQTPEVSDA